MEPAAASQKPLVLVTGGTGFVGSHCVLLLIREGYRVRTTIRKSTGEASVRAMLKHGGVDDPGDRLSFVIADLTSDAGWPEAVSGCEYVLHVASPFPFKAPSNEDELIKPARDGTLRVLKAARDARVRRVVLTSSVAAVAFSDQLAPGEMYTEANWTDPNHPTISPYVKSKAIAERAAWDFVKREGNGMELCAVNPGGIFGPMLGAECAATVEIVKQMLTGALPALPDISMSIVDVRDVAELHLRAMLSPAANGERFIAVAGESLTLQQLAQMLKRRMGNAANRVPTRVLPNWLVWVSSWWMTELKQVVPQLSVVKPVSSEKAQRVLDWKPRAPEEAMVATAESLVQFKLV